MPLYFDLAKNEGVSHPPQVPLGVTLYLYHNIFWLLCQHLNYYLRPFERSHRGIVCLVEGYETWLLGYEIRKTILARNKGLT